jgi:UDP-N-acetylglucosamine 2-epimerase (non-hydrolysing)
MNPLAVVVLGTRPEIIKLAPLVRELGDQAYVVHTGQHFDDAMSAVFLAECGLSVPQHTLAVGGRSRIGQVAGAALELDELFAKVRPGMVVVQGDTNSTLAGALAANAHGIPLLHLEAGLRSHDRSMPEEHNRVLVDHLGDVLCAATPANVAHLRTEGIPPERVKLTGNTIVEAVQLHLPPAEERSRRLARRGLQAGRYVLATVHRPENTDSPPALAAILHELAALVRQGWPVVMPLHPRTAKAATGAGLGKVLAELTPCEPIGYSDFLALAKDAALIVSDSGGVQEEVTVLKRPLIVVRRSTERPEALQTFAKLVSPGPQIGAAAAHWLADPDAVRRSFSREASPYGDGLASKRVATLVRDRLTSAR